LPVEKISITPTEFRTRDDSGNTTFWSGNQYLKTSGGSQFLVGGYQRCPVIAGYGSGAATTNIRDETTAGGFYQRATTGAVTSFANHYQIWPAPINFSSVSLTYDYAPGAPMFVDREISDWLTYYFNGSPAGSYRLLGTVYGRTLQNDASGQLRPAFIWYKIIDYTLNYGPGTYTFYGTATLYNTQTGSQVNSTLPKTIAPGSLHYLSSATSLTLAVTP
jgi:hypothetical protein